MLLTVTPDPVLDRACFIQAWTPGIPMHASRTTVSIGGKGLDASVALSHLGVQTRAFCFLAGQTGENLLGLLEAHDIKICPTWVAGETRTATIVVEEMHQRHTHLFSGGLMIRSEEAESLLETLQMELSNASWLICGGILPSSLDLDFYARVIRLAHAKGIPVLIDSFGTHLQLALADRPDIVKMNWKEFVDTFEVQAPDMRVLIRKAQRTRQHHDLPALVVTCGKQGLLGIEAQGCWLARTPAQAVVNAAGAGDAASGVLAWRLAAGDSWPEALRCAAAAGAAVVLTDTTADLERGDFERILPLVSIEQLA